MTEKKLAPPGEGIEPREEPVAKQASSPATTPTLDEIVRCYRIEDKSDAEDIIADVVAGLQGRESEERKALLRIHLTKTAHNLLKHAVAIAAAVEARKAEIVEEDAKRLEAYAYGETNFCPDRAEIMAALDQYVIALRKLRRRGTWSMTTYGGTGRVMFLDADEAFGKAVVSQIALMRKHIEAMEGIAKVQLATYKDNPLVLVHWTTDLGKRYVACAKRDWSVIA